MRGTRRAIPQAVAGVIVCVLLLAACGGGGKHSGTPTAHPTGTSATPQEGGSVAIQGLQFQSLDPHYSGFSADISIERMVWRGLYRLDQEDKLQPDMAASQPQISADALTYTVTLQPGLKWSDGSPLTAQDFVAGIVRTCSPETAGYYQSFLFNIVGCSDYAASAKDSAAQQQALQQALGVSAPNTTTIVFKLIHPQATFEMQLAMWYTFPVPLQIVQDPATAKWPAPTALAFNGPFEVKSYQESDDIVLAKNPNYHSASSHPAYLDTITIKFIEDTEQADNAFRAGQLQFAMANVAQIKAIKSESSTKDAYFQGPGLTSTTGLQMNLKKAPLNNPKVRLAISQAIDRATLNRVVFGGVNVPTTSWIPEGLLGLPNDPYEKQIGYNPAAAKQDLADAGYPGGKGFPTLSFLIQGSPTDRAQAEFIANALKTTLGITIDVESVDSATRSSRLRSGNWDLLVGGFTQDYPDPEDWVDGQYNTGGSLNLTGCSNPQLDSIFAKAKVDQDRSSRIQEYVEINKLISVGLCGIAPLYHPTNNYLISPKLHGMREHSSDQDFMQAADWDPEDWWLAR